MKNLLAQMFGRQYNDDEEDAEPKENVDVPAKEKIVIPISDGSKASSKDRPPSPKQQNAAATLIQNTYRSYVARRQAFSTLFQLRQRLDGLASSFIFPASPVFSSDKKLLYVPVNAPIHAYEDSLMNLLSKLDAVESGGDKLVRKARKELALAIETALSELDKQKELAWISQQDEEMREEEQVENAIQPEDVELPHSDDSVLEDESESAIATILPCVESQSVASSPETLMRDMDDVEDTVVVETDGSGENDKMETEVDEFVML